MENVQIQQFCGVFFAHLHVLNIIVAVTVQTLHNVTFFSRNTRQSSTKIDKKVPQVNPM